MVIKAAEDHFRQTLRSKGISTVEILAVMKDGKPGFELFGPAEDVKKAKKALGYMKCSDLSKPPAT
jgi:hypothetical protein